MRISPFHLTFLFLLIPVFFSGKIEAGNYFHRQANYSIGHSQWPSYYAYYGGPAYVAYPYTSAYAYYYPSSYANYTYPSYPYFGYYYRNNTIIRSPTYGERREVKPRNEMHYHVNKGQNDVKQGSGVFFYSN